MNLGRGRNRGCPCSCRYVFRLCCFEYYFSLGCDQGARLTRLQIFFPYVQGRGELSTWAGRLSCIFAPATVSVRTSQLIGSFVILNGIITFLNNKSTTTTVSGPR
eukprot:m.427205 g.427205  ORF g.427205 m.427205 type:complete len:105 (-) comp56698_c1_seq7:150-464(-)